MKNIIIERKLKRKKKIRSKIHGSALIPRLSVYRSNKYIFVQLIDDDKRKTLISIHSKKSDEKKETNSTKSSVAFNVGKEFAQKAIKKNIKKVVFDRGGNLYHGRIKSFADGAREGGLEF